MTEPMTEPLSRQTGRCGSCGTDYDYAAACECGYNFPQMKRGAVIAFPELVGE